MADLYDKVVLITGASSGIGAGTAVQYARQGSRLVLTGRNAEKLQHTADLCREVGLPSEKMVVVIADVTKEADLDRIVKAAIDQFGEINVLVNNAGIAMIGYLETLTVDKLETVMNVNCRSVFILTQKVVPYLIESKGCIVNVSSVAGIRANPAMMAYCMSKRALDQMTKTLALDLGPKGVRVNGVNPSTVDDTAIFTKGDGMEERRLPEFFDMLRKNVPLGRLCKVEDVAKAIMFLSTNQPSFVTGYNLPIDGGTNNKTGVNRKADLRKIFEKTTN